MKDEQQPQLWEEVLERLRIVEDELAVHRLLVNYGLAVDSGDREALCHLLTEDAVYDLDSLHIVGREAIADAVFSGAHGAVPPLAAHTVGPLVVKLDGDRATARGYSRLYVAQEEGFVLWRLSLNRWLCVRTADGWRIAHRVTRLVGTAAATELFRS